MTSILLESDSVNITVGTNWGTLKRLIELRNKTL